MYKVYERVCYTTDHSEGVLRPWYSHAGKVNAACARASRDALIPYSLQYYETMPQRPPLATIPVDEGPRRELPYGTKRQI